MNNERLTTITIEKESIKFSAAHFTVFSATERERLHGHNFVVRARITAPVEDNGMTFNYKLFKNELRRLCEEIDEYLILAGESPYLEISSRGKNYLVKFNGEQMTFLKSDTLILPIRNATVEEYSSYLLDNLVTNKSFIERYDIREIYIEVSSGPGQWGSSNWSA